MTEKKDPILLALQKETEAFDPQIYLNKAEAVDGPESVWMSTEVYY